ncbi:MAG: ABC transporter ATP-binding protein [Dehalococcoidia bacterium]
MVQDIDTLKLEAHGLIVDRAARRVLDIAEFGLPAGRVTALIGPNGAGKTTLLMHLALLERATHGNVLFEGAATRGRELALRRRMAVVFQEPLLLDRTVGANVETGMSLRGVARDERKGRVAHWLAAFGITQLAERSARTLSGGEAQRTSLARAFALEPEVLLLDEPFSALDTPTRAAIIDDLAAALAETSVTAMLVTHDHDEAARLGDRVAVMIGGRIRQIGAPASVFGAPADEATAAFVGVETIVPADVTSRSEGLVTLTAHGHVIEAIASGPFKRALVCVRPEDVSVSTGGEIVAGSARNHLPGSVRRVVMLGADARVEIDCGFPVIARVTRRSVEDLGLAEGASVVASFKATAVHLIPK